MNLRIEPRLPRGLPAGLEDLVSGFVLSSRRLRLFPHSLGQWTRRRHATEVMPLVESAAGPFRASLFPEPAGNLDRVDIDLPPPCAFIAGAMHRTMMPATERDRELITDLAAGSG